MVEFDFSRIRTFDGSKDGGFEELVCQLAHLNKPKNDWKFIRKDGAGGDAGVECFWKLEDESEHAWQAKYFLNRMESSEWNQINDSVKAAIEKHPRLTKYYVCLPQDLNDSRKKGRGGKIVKSSLDRWDEYVKEWTSLANSKNMNVEFIFWGRHEITMMLQVDDSHYSGRAYYWFNEPVLNEAIFKNITNKSRVSIGERFSEEYHIELPIVKKLDGLAFSEHWLIDIKEQKQKVNKLLNQINELDRSQKELLEEDDNWSGFKESFDRFKNIYLLTLEEQYSANQFDLVRKEVDKLEQKRSSFEEISWSYFDQHNKEWMEINREFRRISSEIKLIKDFLISDKVKAYESKSAVILGEAGIGKSHLLCDIALNRLEKNQPTVFLLGQRYAGGNPLNFLAEELDLKTASYKQMFGALDAVGEARRTRTLILIDALNEGNHRHDWLNHLSIFITELANYSHIALLISCRETYKDMIIPNSIEDVLIKIQHVGFKGFEHRAAMKYLAKQGIDKPAMPILSPEFSNPLFLKTCCKAIKSKGLNSFPKGLEGQTAIFDFYLESIEEIINRKKRYFRGQEIVPKVVNLIVEQLYPKNMFGIEISVAIELINTLDTKPNIDEDLMSLLIDEGLLSLDIITDDKGLKMEVVRFTYERFSDYFIVKLLVNQLNSENLEMEFEADGSMGRILEKCYMYSGLVEALGIAFPEKFNKEFIEFIPEDSPKYEFIFNRSFSDVLLLRNKNSITDRSIKLLNKISEYGYVKESLEKLLALSTEPEHPLNSEFLHRNLKRFTMSERDFFWSTHIAISDYEEDEEQPESIVRTLINWAITANLDGVEKERIRLLSFVLLWMTTTSNRKVRDQATKSLVRVLCAEPSCTLELLTEFTSVDDIYLRERLYASIYGVVCNIEDLEIVKRVAEKIYEIEFKNGSPYPHLLLRDYARGVMEYALSKNLINKEMSLNIRPPYKSEWPIENPTKSELKDLMDDEYSSIKSSVMGFPGDFGNYTMSCIHDWSPTMLTEEKPESAYQLHLKFVNKLPEILREAYLTKIKERIKEYEKERNLILIDDIFEEAEDEELKKIIIKTRNVESSSDDWNTLKEQINNILSEEDKETFRWISGLGVTNRLAKFSRKMAQRWVCKRAYELGWKKELFDKFERTYSSNYDRGTSTIERIGKKYQWIALYEFLARMADNLYWIDEYEEEKTYEGPWQLWKRDIDPTIWLRSTNDSGRDEFSQTWWSPYIPKFDSTDSETWVYDDSDLPNFNSLFRVRNPRETNEWYVLRGFRKWINKNEENRLKEELWYRINTCIVKKNDVTKVMEKMKNQALFDPSIFSPQGSSHQGFLREYPWHPYYDYINEWQGCMDENRYLDIEHLVPSNEYEWETGERDKSIEQYISIYLPNKLFIKDLGLVPSLKEFSVWKDQKGNEVFFDPSEQENGPSFALMNVKALNEWLEANDLQLIWFVGGEKQIFNEQGYVTKRLEYNYIYTFIDGERKEEKWTEQFQFRN